MSLVTAVYRSHLQDPFLLGLKKEGDEKFQAQLYEEAATIYTFALNYPNFTSHGYFCHCRKAFLQESRVFL